MSKQHHLFGAPLVALGIPEFVFEERLPLRCRDDPDAYFADGVRSERARVLCAGCGYLEACGAYAFDRPELWGVWGGTTRRERESLRRQRSSGGVPTAS